MKRNRKRNSGFTLIEIIAVLVILGILAAVAVPRYVALQNDARNKAADGAIAAAKSALSMTWARYILVNNTAPTRAQLLGHADITGTANCGVNDAEFTVACIAGTAADEIAITATGVANTPAAGGVATGTYNMPQ